MNTDIQLYNHLSAHPQEMESMGRLMAKSNVFGFTREEQGVTMLLICVTERITPLQFMERYHVMPTGKFSKKAMRALVEFEELGGKFTWIETGDEPAADESKRQATAEFKLKHHSLKYSYSMADAVREGITKKDSRWEKRPGQMLRARVCTNALGMICPQIFAGVTDDDDVAAPTLDLGKSPPAPAPETKTEVIDIKVETVAAAAPSTKEDGETVIIKPEIFKAEADADGKLTMDTIAALQTAMGEHADAAAAELMKRKWFETDMRVMTAGRAQRILDNPKGFLKAIGILPAKAA